jgi:hypothetical protein
MVSFNRSHQDEPDYEQWEDACHEGERNADNSFLGNIAKPDTEKKP